MSIPDNLKDLVEIVGEDKALEIIQRYEGKSIYFNKKALRELKHKHLLWDYKAGKSIEELAEKYGYTITYVRILLKSVSMSKKNKPIT